MVIESALALSGAVLAAALSLIFGGAALAWTSSLALKRVLGLMIMFLGALLVLGALGAPAGALVLAVVLALATAVLGFALSVRIQEAYGASALDEVARADADTDDAEANS